MHYLEVLILLLMVLILIPIQHLSRVCPIMLMIEM
nr:MAG TPA: hypothetical protein [Caudoviricetes sp.]